MSNLLPVVGLEVFVVGHGAEVGFLCLKNTQVQC